MFKIEKFREKGLLNLVKEKKKKCFFCSSRVHLSRLFSSANYAIEPGLRVDPVVFWLYVNHRKFVEAGPGNMSYVCPDKIGESLCLSVVDEAYCIELTGKN